MYTKQLGTSPKLAYTRAEDLRQIRGRYLTKDTVLQLKNGF